MKSHLLVQGEHYDTRESIVPLWRRLRPQTSDILMGTTVLKESAEVRSSCSCIRPVVYKLQSSSRAI